MIEQALKTKCFIFDIDGTVAHRTNRTPYEYDKVSDDVPDITMQMIYRSLRSSNSGTEFIFITGRDESCRETTLQWLWAHGFGHDKLFMKPPGSKELDTAHKLNIYNIHIKPDHEVIAVFEDRKRCVELYRNHLGLKVLQVAEGNY